jgi:hypothetical protein
MNKILESHYEHDAESQYELIRKTVDENNQYYTDFLNEFLNAAKIKANSENITSSGTFELYEVEDKMEIPLNYNLMSRSVYARLTSIAGENVWYAITSSPYHVLELHYWFGYSHTFLVEYFIIYIPDEYNTDTNLKAILDGDNFESLLFRKGNLYVVGRMDNRV